MPERLRITPAYAGKSYICNCLKATDEDHPRLRGEKIHASLDISNEAGSPPLTRGKVNDIRYAFRQFGITPAYAGKRLTAWFINGTCKDHPRLRGEKRLWRCTSQGFLGSPPLTRGKAGIALVSLSYAGITPAYAGKSCRVYSFHP